MSTLDLAEEHEFHYSDDEDCTEEGAYESGQGAKAKAFSNGEDSYNSGEEGQRKGVQQVDYSQLESGVGATCVNPRRQQLEGWTAYARGTSKDRGRGAGILSGSARHRIRGQPRRVGGTRLWW